MRLKYSGDSERKMSLEVGNTGAGGGHISLGTSEEESWLFCWKLFPPDIWNLGEAITVSGTLEANAIHVSSLQLLNSIGLPVGQKAPAFSARDQFGREQTLESLKGPHGTVVLFFRSADW